MTGVKGLFVKAKARIWLICSKFAQQRKAGMYGGKALLGFEMKEAHNLLVEQLILELQRPLPFDMVLAFG